MTCHHFERQASDWLSRRLPPRASEEMAAHEQECGQCRRMAQAEANLRRCFQAQAMPPHTPLLSGLPEIWPRLALRLEAETPKTHRRQTLLFPRRWAIATAVALAAGAACWSHLPDSAGSGRTAGSERTVPASALTASSAETLPPGQVPAWLRLGNAAQNDPAVDDPVGPNMENMWTCLNTESK